MSSSPSMDGMLADDDQIGCGLGQALEEDHAVDMCGLCENKMRSPKVLSCLHVFCEECLKKRLDSDRQEESMSPTSPLAKEWMMDLLKCPSCEQKTRLPDKGVAGLLADTVLEDWIESDNGDNKQIGCTSCKAGDNAVAKCRTCENLLCPNCVTAHQFMRCFEDHKVVTFEEMIKTGEGIEHLRKPVFCTIHIVESIKFFCSSCLVPACAECIQKCHNTPEHVVKQLAEAVGAKKETLAEFTKECGKKLVECQKINTSLGAAFEDLEMQKDNTKGLIQETFQSYKALLEDVKDHFLNEADELHKKRELCIMERMHKLSTYESQLCQAKSFVERVCHYGHAGQIGQLLQTMLAQLNTLCMGFIMPDIPANTEFKTDPASYEAAVKSTFGYFSRDKHSPGNGSSLCSPFEAERFSLPNMMMDSGNMMQSHMNQDLLNISNLSGMPININVGHRMDSLPISSVISGIGSVHLSHHVDGNTASGNNSPLSDSGISVDNISHSGGSNAAAMMNAAAMSKMHPNQSPLFAPGMSINVSGPSIMGASNAITSGAGDNALASILCSTNTVSSSAASTVQNANIEGLASLLNQPPPPTISTFSGVGAYEPYGQMQPELGSPGSQYSSDGYPSMRRANKMNAMQIRCKFGQLGPGKGQFNSPHGFCLGVDEDIVVADTNNHRIQVFQKTGDFKYQFGIPGREEGQLWYPRKVAVMLKTGKFVVCDRGNERSRMQIFNRNGHFLKKIAIRYIDIVAGLAITPEGHIVAVDSVSPTVFVISESGDLIKWFDCSDFMREPSDIAINNNEFFVCDFKGHCVVVFARDGTFLRRIGCENITNYPNGIDISGHGDVLIGDGHGNRFHVGVFQREGSLISEFQCPYVKVSRCCGLKITTEGYIVTLAKNNHHVLVLNTLYIP